MDPHLGKQPRDMNDYVLLSGPFLMKLALTIRETYGLGLSILL